MVDILSSSEAFMAYARIDYCLWALELIEKTPICPILTPKEKRKAEIEQIDESIKLLEEIVRCKKVIEADYNTEVIAILQLHNLKEIAS